MISTRTYTGITVTNFQLREDSISYSLLILNLILIIEKKYKFKVFKSVDKDLKKSKSVTLIVQFELVSLTNT